MSDEEFADARGCFGGDEPDLSASIIKTDYGWVCMVCDTEFSVTYDTDNTLTIKCGDIVSNTVQVKSNANRFNKVTQGDNTNRTVFYTNTSQEEKDNYKLVSTYTVDSESISYNWYSTNSAYSADELGAAVSGSNGEFKLADNIPAGNYVLYCDITYSDGDSTETVTEKFTFTYKECAHENGYSDGKCTNCGALCDHSNIDINTGKCNECERQFVATISTDGNAPTGYDTLADCLNSITADTGNSVKIYQDIGDTSATAILDTIDVKHNVMIDLNGHKLNNIKLGVNKLGVNKDVTLTLTGTAGSYVTQVYVRKGGGSFIIDSEANVEFNTIFVEDSARLAVNDGAKVTTEQLTVIASVNDDGTTTTSVKLATGMKLGGLTYHRQNNSGALKLGNLLDVTRQALRREDNGNYLDLYKEYGSMGYSVALTVVEHTDADHKYSDGTGKCEECGKPCEHGGDINTDTGICSVCGAVVSVALYTDKNGSLKYVDTDELHSLLNEYNGSGTIKLFKDYDNSKAQYDLYGELTIDLNGRRLNIRSITPCKNGKLTIKNSGNPVMLGCNVYPTNDASYAGGTLIIDGDVVLDTSIYVYDSSTVILKDGTYTAGLYARDSKTLYDMLGEGKAFFKTDGTLFNASVKEISSIVTLIVKDHSHTYVDGKCDCGYVCPHSDVNSETGVCLTCEYQLTAGVSGVGTAKYFDNIDDAFTAALSEENNGCTLTLYKDCELSQNIVIGNATLTVDVNGHFISPEIRGIDVNDGGVLYLKNSGENGSIGLEMAVNKGGTLINGTADDSSSAVSLFAVTADAAECVEFYGGSCTYLTIKNGTSGIALYGGYYDIICGSLTDNTPVNDLLAKGYAFATLNSVTHLPESIVDGSAKTIGDGLTNVMVVAHEHRYNVETGKCPCGVCALAIFTETTQSSETYTFIESETQFKNIAENEADGVLKLTGDVDCIVKGIIINGNKTIDMNGHTLNVSVGTEEISAVAVYGNVTFENSGSSRAVINATGVYSYGMVTVNGDIEFDTFATFEDGDALINAGVFKNIYVQGRSVIEILGSGKALASESGEILNASVQQIYRVGDNIFVTAHPKHTYDDHGNCACGYKCLHDGEGQVNEDSANKVCSECGAKIYAKVTTADGKVKYFDDITEGLRYADKAENKGCVFTLVTSGEIKSEVTLSSGQFTIAANNYGTIDKNSGGRINIDGADVIAEGHMLINCHIYMISGSLTLPEGSSTRFGAIFMSGGTVNISEGVNADNNAGADKLLIPVSTTDAKVTIGGGTYGNVYFGQLKLKDVLASGARVIRYDNSSDSTAEKTATALLYSDIAEESSLAYSDGRYYLVSKCEHKNEDGSYAFNEGGICKYCNSEFAASVSYTVDGSAKTELFSDICDAFDKANEAGTATITLCRDIADSEIAHEINVTGNLALELNTKTLGATDKAKKIYICGSTLTVNGNGKVWSTIEAKPDSKLTITNGEYNDVYALSDSEVVILDGIIDCLSVYGTGKAEVSGGKFKYLFMYNGKAIESVLADGYAYKNADGTWLSIDEREKDSYLGGSIGALSVEEAPIKSASIAWVGEEAPVIYRNGEKYLYVDITYELAVGSRGATYSDFVNGNNRIKDYNLYNKYMVHCYEIGKLAAKDGEVEYYIVLKCNGYEYKSNVLKLTLATCSHPEDSFSYENDGFVICGICDALIEAEVVDADGKSLGYADIESAIKLAQANEGSTVKLMSEGVSSAAEFTTVTGGKFTVDFNGKKVFYQFDVNGGDVTFTSSVKQADVETLISGITVNGTDAKVTIDGKIKLGSVTLTSGALKINSTDGYIKELSINGGATVINGANIDALKTYGGDTVINNVEADSLSVNINGSGSISIVTGEFGSTTFERDSGYTLGMAIASGSIVCINSFTIYTYEAIQTMTKTDRIYVEKCVHKDGSGSYVLDGNPCPYCKEEIVATVSYTANGGEETDLFTDIYDAFDKANEVGTATVTLYKDIAGSEFTRDINVTGDVTLELNGKSLGGVYGTACIQVTDGGKLTVNGNGKIWRSVDVKANSKLTVNSGDFDTVIIYKDGSAEISGGTVTTLNIYGKAKISGGLFSSIYTNSTIESYLADGYAYKKNGGAWLSIAERAEKEYYSSDNDNIPVNVEEAPIKSATITAEDESPIIYRNGNNSVDYTANVTYSGNETLCVTGCLIDGTVIKEKTELLNGRCSLGSGEVADVVAEDGEIQYYCIFTYDGYEYKSNAITLTVATCQHPVESVKCDDNGNYVCGICDRALPASVELSDGTLSYYDNLNDAIGAAQESEGCTLKLVSRDQTGDTVRISGGKFTVDLAGVPALYEFKITGGDVTFKSSEEFSSEYSDRCYITVNGSDAKVTIDGKIELETEQLSDGTFTTNSTEAYIEELSIWDGKATVDGAYIRTIMIYGGNTVIKDVISNLMKMRGSWYDNTSIVSGRFGFVACNGYALYKAIASGSRVTGFDMNVGLYKYADIQKKTEIANIIVEKCDHKDVNDSYVLDGNLCPYCNEEIVATVSYTTAGGSEQTDLFSDIYDAFDKANEAGTATVTLYKDITNSELTQGVTITGNVTLALNGKKLGGTFAFNAPVEVSDGGMFTVGGDGKMRMPIKAYANSKLIINGGEFTSVMVYIDGDAEIGGGVIDALTIIGNAKAKISGGKFYNIEIANGSLESVLADGYAYKKDGGAWLSIAERAESVYSSVNNDNKPVNVEEAPIKSATLSTEINKLYRNSNANPTLKFNLALAHGSNLNDSYVSKRYGINSYVSGDIIYSSLSALVKDAKLSADEIIDKAGDSDVAEIYFVVTTGDGYEIKSNAVSIDLVDCDHSQVVDPTADKETAGNITEPTYCEICESKFNAKITKGDDVKYYNDLDEAAKDAQKSENEGCTLYPLYNKNGYGGQLVITEGNFTLKYAVRTAFSRPIIINGKAKLTVTGRCAVTASENQDAFIVRGGDVTFDGLATGSNVTINGGNVTMAANNINCLTINGGNVSISSGGFAEIVTTVSDKVIADYIDPGFWVQDRGTKEWIDIYSLNKATASSTSGLTVRLCPMQIIKPIDTVYYTNGYYPDGIPSLQISAVPWYSGEVDAKVAYQWIAIDENGYETVIEGATGETLSLENLTTGRYYCSLTYSNATTAGVSMASDVVTATITECEHSGGEATCTNKAKCEICGAEYGEPLGHDYVVINVVEPDYCNEGYSVFECTRCKNMYLGNFVPVKPIPDVEEIAVEKTTYNEVDISWKNISGVDGYYVEGYVGDQWTKFSFSTDGDRGVAKLSGLSAGLKYKVRIAAYAGSFTGKYRYFYVDTVPSPVWNINTVKATDETVRISWNRNTRADGYKVEWYIDNQWSVKTVTGNNNISAVIDGLCAGTRYKVRVSAYKGDLYSPYTYGYIDTLPSKVTGITQTVTSSSFTLTWDKNESADGYTVQYYADGKWNEKSLVGNDKTAVTIGSLKGYKTYKVRIKAYKGELESAFDDIYITTAPTKVSGLKVKSAVDSKAVVIWNADANADGYNVEYYIGGKWVKKTITDNKTAKAVLGGLTPYITYKVRVRAYKDNLYGDYSYTTVTAVLSPVTNIKVVSAKSNSITVKWGKNASADGYKVEIYKGGKWVKKTLKGSTNATVTIGGLRAGSVYKVRIASYKGANTSTYTYANVKTAK